MAPETTERLQRWKESLGTGLKSLHPVCHLHFKEEDIIWYHKFTVNGEVIIFPNAKKQLKDDAVPTVDHQFVPVNFNALKTISQKQCQEEIDIKQEDVIEPEFIEINLEPWSPLSQDEDDPATSRQETEARVATSRQETEARTATNHRETEPRTQLEDFRDNIPKYSMLPPSWLYLDKPNGLEFIRMDLKSRQIVNHLRLNEDLSITVIFPNNEELSLNDKIYSFRDIYDYLKSVERWPLCVGTQMDSKKYSRLCKGVIIGDETYQRCQQNPRCKSCRILRRRLQTKTNRAKQCEHFQRMMATHQ